MLLHNTLNAKKEEFLPSEPGHVRMYVCGVTVYDRCHIGHARGAVFFDVLRKYFQWIGYKVTYVRNITDVDDKIIKRSIKENKSPEDIARTYTDYYYEDMDRLGVDKADIEPHATDHIQDIIDLTKKLLDAGMAYPVDGDVYFSVRKYSRYGQLSGKKIEDLLSGARVEIDERKDDPLDFALWKSAQPGEPKWESPFGPGRPGWHIECSAMSMKYLGESFDIHGGGSDLIFPHHENEMAQSGAVSGKPLARFWVHNGFITWNKEKMSKSRGNFFTLSDILEKISPDALRYFLLSTHYRHPIEFSDTALESAGQAVERVTNSLARLERLGFDIEDLKKSNIKYDSSDETIVDFNKAMDDDVNTPRAIAAIFNRLTLLNNQIDSQEEEKINKSASVVIALLSLLGFQLKKKDNSSDNNDWIEKKISERAAARKNKNWRKADNIRDELLEKGIIIEDTPEGTFFRKK